MHNEMYRFLYWLLSIDKYLQAVIFYENLVVQISSRRRYRFNIFHPFPSSYNKSTSISRHNAAPEATGSISHLIDSTPRQTTTQSSFRISFHLTLESAISHLPSKPKKTSSLSPERRHPNIEHFLPGQSPFCPRSLLQKLHPVCFPQAMTHVLLQFCRAHRTQTEIHDAKSPRKGNGSSSRAASQSVCPVWIKNYHLLCRVLRNKCFHYVRLHKISYLSLSDFPFVMLPLTSHFHLWGAPRSCHYYRHLSIGDFPIDAPSSPLSSLAHYHRFSYIFISLFVIDSKNE